MFSKFEYASNNIDPLYEYLILRTLFTQSWAVYLSNTFHWCRKYFVIRFKVLYTIPVIVNMPEFMLLLLHMPTWILLVFHYLCYYGHSDPFVINLLVVLSLGSSHMIMSWRTYCNQLWVISIKTNTLSAWSVIKPCIVHMLSNIDNIMPPVLFQLLLYWIDFSAG